MCLEIVVVELELELECRKFHDGREKFFLDEIFRFDACVGELNLNDKERQGKAKLEDAAQIQSVNDRHKQTALQKAQASVKTTIDTKFLK